MGHKTNTFSQNILKWFKNHGRKNLPWQSSNSYHVWISEIMLQQTQVKKVIEYYKNFIKQFPNMKVLAQADTQDVLLYWSGLGYYNRATNIHKTAQICVKEYASTLPINLKELMALPGIGKTTAGAILSLASNLPYPILDGNVKRVISRVYTTNANNLNQLNNKHWKIVTELVPKTNARDFNQALMDLGSMICTRSKPKCPKCPMTKICIAYNLDKIDLYPQTKAKTKQINKSYYLLMLVKNNKLYLQQRDIQSIWPQLWFLPMFETQKDVYNYNEYQKIKNPQEIQFDIKHILTHRKLTLHVTCINIRTTHKLDKDWIKLSDYQQLPHPTALVKIIKHYHAII